MLYFPDKRLDTHARKVDGMPESYNELNAKGTVKMATDDETSKRKLYLPELLQELNRPTSSDLARLPAGNSITEGTSAEASLDALKSGTGTLMIFRKRQREDQDTEEWTRLDNLEGKEWLAVFVNILHCPIEVDEPYAPGDSLDELDERIRLKFQRAIPEYPMLGRIWDTYIDIMYQQEEISELRDECLKVVALASSNPVALQGLGKLIAACDEALGRGDSIMLACN
jgi:hypothetical protein